MSHSHRRLLARVASALFILRFTSPLALADEAKPVAVRVLLPQTTAALPFLMMAHKNPIPGIDVKVAFFANHALALSILMRGETDLLLSGTSQGWENSLDGSPIVMLDSGVWGLASLVGTDAAIKGFANLKGRRIGLPFPGSPLDFQSRTLLAFEKIDPDKDLTISYGPFEQNLQRLLAGRLDATALPEPLATIAVRKNGMLRLLRYSSAWARFTGGDEESPQVSLFALQPYARDHAAIITSVLSAWDSASRDVSASPAKAAAQFAAALQLEPAILEEATRNTLLSVPSPEENKRRVLAYYQIVSRYFPAGPRPLDKRFFFRP
jgi:ABC-type nitrate/sulfonate/bicarbonate transport system substrate-binding protein